LLQYFITHQKNESVCETSEQFFITRVQNACLVGKFLRQSYGNFFYIPTVFDQNSIFETQLSFKVKHTFSM